MTPTTDANSAHPAEICASTEDAIRDVEAFLNYYAQHGDPETVAAIDVVLTAARKSGA